MKLTRAGHVAFAATLIALGIWGLVRRDFSPVWAPVAPDAPARDLLLYACPLVFVACGAGLLLTRTSRIAGRVLLVSLLAWVVAFRVRTIVHAPEAFDAWDGCAENAVMIAAAWIVAGLDARFGRALFGLALVPFGIAHLIYAKQTAVLVPSYLPAHEAIAYATGVTFLAAGAAILVGMVATRLAAVLATIQIGMFTVLVWVPMVARGGANAFQWSELGVSVALTAGAWVVADSYRA